jgi:hypothetical protein
VIIAMCMLHELPAAGRQVRDGAARGDVAGSTLAIQRRVLGPIPWWQYAHSHGGVIGTWWGVERVYMGPQYLGSVHSGSGCRIRKAQRWAGALGLSVDCAVRLCVATHCRIRRAQWRSGCARVECEIVLCACTWL